MSAEMYFRVLESKQDEPFTIQSYYSSALGLLVRLYCCEFLYFGPQKRGKKLKRLK